MASSSMQKKRIHLLVACAAATMTEALQPWSSTTVSDSGNEQEDVADPACGLLDGFDPGEVFSKVYMPRLRGFVKRSQNLASWNMISDTIEYWDKEQDPVQPTPLVKFDMQAFQELENADSSAFADQRSTIISKALDFTEDMLRTSHNVLNHFISKKWYDGANTQGALLRWRNQRKQTENHEAVYEKYMKSEVSRSDLTLAFLLAAPGYMENLTAVLKNLASDSDTSVQQRFDSIDKMLQRFSDFCQGQAPAEHSA